MKNNKEKRIHALCVGTSQKVYVYLSDAETQKKFINDAEQEGYHFSDGSKLSERDEYIALIEHPQPTKLNTCVALN